MTGLTEEEKAAYIDAGQIMPDNWMCTWCNVDCVTYEGFIEHMKSVHNMQ